MSTRVIILAAGKGTRMGSDIPKPLVEIAGRPMIEHLIDSVHESGLDENPIVVVSPDGVGHFRTLCRDSYCEYVVQDEQLGTGNAAQAARSAAHGTDTIVVLYGDHPFIPSETMSKLIELHERSDASLTMLTAKVKNFKKDNSGFERWGRILRDDTGRITGIREAKDATDEELKITEVNPAIYAFRADWLWDHLMELKNENANKEYYLTDLVEIAIEDGDDVVTAPSKPFEVMGINTPEELEQAQKLFG